MLKKNQKQNPKAKKPIAPKPRKREEHSESDDEWAGVDAPVNESAHDAAVDDNGNIIADKSTPASKTIPQRTESKSEEGEGDASDSISETEDEVDDEGRGRDANESDVDGGSNENNEANVNPGRMTQSQRAGLVFPVGRIGRYLKEGGYADRVMKTGSVFLAAVLEYMAAEVLEVTGEICHEQNRKRLKPSDVAMAIQSDAELGKLCSQSIFPNSRVLPNLRPELLKKKQVPIQANNEDEGSSSDDPDYQSGMPEQSQA